MLSTPGSKAATQTLFTLAAHDGACTSFDISPHIPGCLATGGSDKVVKLWSIEEEPVESDVSKEAKKPKGISMVTSRDLDAVSSFAYLYAHAYTDAERTTRRARSSRPTSRPTIRSH